MILITRVNKNGKDYEYETYNNYVMKFEYCRFSFIIINHALIVGTCSISKDLFACGSRTA